MSSAEKIAKMNAWEKWIYALKVKSWPKLLVPCFFGQCFGYFHSPLPSLSIVFLGLLFTIFLLGYIVLLNDYADINVDTIKRKLFPNDCSPKTIPDQILNQRSILIAGIISGFLSMFVAFMLELYTERSFVLFFSFVCIIVFAAYSLPPLRLNYRGGGELLEMIGVGFMLPLFHFYLHLGIQYDSVFLSLLLISTLFAFSSALASGLSDEESDRIGGKSTFVNRFGNANVRTMITMTVIINYFLMIVFCFYFYEILPLAFIIFILLYFLYHIYFILKFSPIAVTNAFGPQKIYKDHLHKLIWGSIILLSLILNLSFVSRVI